MPVGDPHVLTLGDCASLFLRNRVGKRPAAEIRAPVEPRIRDDDGAIVVRNDCRIANSVESDVHDFLEVLCPISVEVEARRRLVPSRQRARLALATLRLASDNHLTSRKFLAHSGCLGFWLLNCIAFVPSLEKLLRIHSFHRSVRPNSVVFVIQQVDRRHDHLIMATYLRCNDVNLGLSNDVFCITMLQEILERVLNVEFETYKHRVGSLHLYGK